MNNININKILQTTITHIKKHKLLYIGLIIIIIIQLNSFSSLNYLPGPLYGGDVYRERGFTEHIYQGYPICEDPQIQGEVAFRPQFSYMLVAGLSHLGLGTIDRIFLYVMLLSTVICTLTVYLIAQKISKKIYIAAISTYIYYGINFIPSVKPTASLGFAFLLLFIYYMYKVIEKGSLKNKIIAGIFIGLTSLSHLGPLIHLMIIVISIIFLEGLYVVLRNKKEFFKEIWIYIKKVLDKSLIPLIIGCSISMAYFFPIFLLGKNKIINRVNEYALQSPEFMNILDVIKVVFQKFLNFSNVAIFIMSLIALIGLIYCILKIKNLKYRLPLFVFIGAIIASSHFLITVPLFNFWITPTHIFSIFGVIQLYFIIIGLFVLLTLSKKNKIIFLSLIILIILLSSFLVFQSLNNFKDSKWTKPYFEKQPWLDEMFDFREWVLENTDKYDIFLSNDETAFAINALTARKMVLLRRVHASQYVDINKRYADGFVMLYGKDLEKIKKLINQYRVKYLVLDTYLLQNQMFTDIKYADYLSENGIKYETGLVRWDPSVVDSQKIKSVIVPPQNITLIDNNLVKGVYKNSQMIVLELNI